MPAFRNAGQIHARESIGVFIMPNGEAINIPATREFYRWMAQVERLTGVNSPLARVEDETIDQSNAIAQNTTDIDTNNTSISQINADLVVITGNLASLALLLSAHVSSTITHGALGNIVGDLNFAQLAPLPAGVVNQAVDVGDPTGTFVNLAAVEAWAVQLRTNLQNAGIMS